MKWTTVTGTGDGDVVGDKGLSGDLGRRMSPRGACADAGPGWKTEDVGLSSPPDRLPAEEGDRGGRLPWPANHVSVAATAASSPASGAVGMRKQIVRQIIKPVLKCTRSRNPLRSRLTQDVGIRGPISAPPRNAIDTHPWSGVLSGGRHLIGPSAISERSRRGCLVAPCD